jgi:esterase
MEPRLRGFCVFSIFALLVAVAGCQTAQKPSWELPAGIKSLEANGYPIAYMERGSGPTVVLVHGALNDYRTFLPQIEPLSSRFRVISVSLRHYYPEPWKGDGEFSLQLHAKDMAVFIDRLGAGPVLLVGWSRGGYVAADVARMRPELVRKLVLMDPGFWSLLQKPGDPPTEDVRVRRAKATEPYFRRGDMEGGLQFFFDDVNGAGAWTRLPEAQRQLRRDNAWTVVGRPGDLETLGCQDLGRLRMPVLLMQGENSPAPFKRMHAATQQCVSSARLVVIPKAAHQMHQMNPSGVNAELLKFLSE